MSRTSRISRTTAHRHDDRIRRVLLDRLGASFGPDAVIVSELGILEGRSRVDVACVHDRLDDYEIKSAADAIDRRLEWQVAAYSRVLDRATLVVAEGKLQTALRKVPDWWSVLVVPGGDRQGTLEVFRQGTDNPWPEPLAIAQLLWRDEALRLLRERGAARGLSRRPRRMLWERLCEELTLDELRLAVRRFLWRRFASTQTQE